MKRIFLVCIALILLIGLVPTAVFAYDWTDDWTINEVYLYQKDPNTWQVVPNGAWARLSFYVKGPQFSYLVEGYELAKNTYYSLIYYADKCDRFNNWGGDNPGAFIAKGRTDRWGNLCDMKGEKELNMDMPSPPDVNYPDGAKIWLVPSSDYDAVNAKLIAWNPTSYLFEDELIKYDDNQVGVTLLENKDGSWNPIDDCTRGGLIYRQKGKEFKFSFLADGLTAGTAYSLIYYADPYAGNNPGAFIGGGAADGNGILKLSGLVELNMNLPQPPDANYPTGAKIWLVPSSDYNAATKSMTAWNPAAYLFECNWTNYDDTQVP